MDRMLRLFFSLFCLAFLISCGSKKSPTGGALDTDKPTVLTTFPAQYGQLDQGRIEINFSKHLDKSSVPQAIYIYPPVLNKKVTVDKSTLRIELMEKLQANTNYYITLSTRLKDIRGNALAQNQTMVFAHGEFNNLRLAGTIGYEDPGDFGLPVQVSLLSADSLLVLNQKLSGGAYAIDALNPSSYILRAYVDKNLNGRYDISQDPWFEQHFTLSRMTNIDLFLAYADTTKPVLRNVQAKSSRQVEAIFSENVARYGSVLVKRADNDDQLPVIVSKLKDNKLTLLTAVQDTTTYILELREVQDAKGNTTAISSLRFRASTLVDETPPDVVFTNPRNGTSVNSLEPVLEVHFSEIIPSGGFSATLLEGSGPNEIPFSVLASDDTIYRLRPTRPLQNYRSHLLKLSASDINGNTVDFELNFLPLKRD